MSRIHTQGNGDVVKDVVRDWAMLSRGRQSHESVSNLRSPNVSPRCSLSVSPTRQAHKRLALSDCPDVSLTSLTIVRRKSFFSLSELLGSAQWSRHEYSRSVVLLQRINFRRGHRDDSAHVVKGGGGTSLGKWQRHHSDVRYCYNLLAERYYCYNAVE